ncbi:hypothetical protein V492_01542 [Pseudogymnoascus sp. VKM F-4246]|nr:hypothetical protein V492_01542 [Pseudogymnoascus sp. VKM F-4246]
MASQRLGLATYFVPATGIDREVISTDIGRYLGNDARVKPGMHNVTPSAVSFIISHTDGAQNSKGEPIPGYFINSYRALTTDQLTSIKADSARWGAERTKIQTIGGLQGGDITYRSSLTRARQQQPSWDDTLQAAAPQAAAPQAAAPPEPHGVPLGYSLSQNYSYGAPVMHGLSRGPFQQPRSIFSPNNALYRDSREINQTYQPDNSVPQGSYNQPLLKPQGDQGQPAIPQQLSYLDSLPAPQEDQDKDYGYEDVFAVQQGQPPKPTSSRNSRYWDEHSDRDSDRRMDRHSFRFGQTQLFATVKELGNEAKPLAPAISQDTLGESVDSDVSPETLQSTLASGIIEDIKRLLDQHFSSVAKEDFVWLQELREHGYGTEEIAQLLANEQNDSPWIYFEPRHIPRGAITPDHHEASCVHMGGHEVGHRTGSSTATMDKKDYRLSWTSDNESLTYIEELCGIAGVVPNTRDLSKQVGSVKFVEEDDTLTASVSYHPDSKDEKDHKLPSHDDSSNILQALENLCSAIALAQRSGICCDSFTILQFSVISDHKVIELCRIKVRVVLDLYSEFLSFIANPRVEDWKGIFQGAALSSFTTTTFEGALDYYSLAVQFFSVGFSSYVKSHVGAMRPFFLDTSLSVIQLFGLQDKETQSPRLTASLHRLTCLDNMIQNPVLVFRQGQARKQKTQKSYNLLASPEDLVDTWGPGQFLTSSSMAGTHLSSILIGGGVIKPTSENNLVLHWSGDVEPRHNFSVRFSKTKKALIAGGAAVNMTCKSNRKEIWASFIGSLENLGTTADYWQFTEFQAGVAVMGQQFVGAQLQFNKTWTWHPGNSWKRQLLSLIADELPFNELDRPWGLQVSACTGVARRVPLRLLLADTMPTFARNLALPSGWTTLRQRGIIQALEQGGQVLKQWYDELCKLPNVQDLQILTTRLIKYILLVLRDTGIDRDHKTFIIACPQGYTTGQPISMYLPVPCENASLWAKILRDSENCATFACMTNLCLESEEHKCHQTNPWHCPSLDTAVQQVRLRKEPITISSQAWNLEIDSLYWIGVPESGLQARVMKSAKSPFPRLHISRSGIPEKTRARLGTMSRLFGPKMNRLREKQIEAWPAEDVLILSQSK